MDTIQTRMSELGYDTRLPPPIASMPAGGGHWATQHVDAFNSIWNLASRTYPQAFDEAVRDSRQNALAIRRDYVVDGAMRKLIIPICQQAWQIEPVSPDDPQLKEDSERVTAVLNNFPRPGLHQLFRMFCESRFFGRYGTQMLFQWDWVDWQRSMKVQEFIPVHGDKIVFRFNGRPGILVSPGVYPGPWTATEAGACHFLTDAELEQFFWCEFNPEDADYREPQFSGKRFGVGFRDKLYWPWWLREQILQQTLRYLKRAANGYTVGFFDAQNPGAENRLAAKLRSYTGDDFLLFPRDRQENTPYGLEHKPVPLQGSRLFMDLIRWINDMIADYILGEELTTSSKSTGLGTGQAEAHETTADQRTKYHSADIQVAMQDLMKVLFRYNAPGRPAGKFSFLNEKRNPEEYMKAVDFAYSHGLAIEEDDVRDVLGLQSPRRGKSVLAAMVPGQPAAIGGAPQGMPMAMPGGPQQQQQQFSRLSRRGQRDRQQPGVYMHNGELYSVGV